MSVTQQKIRLEPVPEISTRLVTMATLCFTNPVVQPRDFQFQS